MSTEIVKNPHKYTKVVRHGKAGTHLTVSDDAQIVIQEKLDGANAMFRVNEDADGIDVYSRNTKLDEHNTLRGFYNFVQENIGVKDILPSFVYVGEWLVKHKIDYGEENMNQFYLFDIYSLMDEEYLSFEDVKIEAEELQDKGVNIIPVFYQGEYQSFEHLQSFVGQSKLGEQGEGVVVKNVDYKDVRGYQTFTKLVSPEFQEMQQPKSRGKQATDPTKRSPERQFVDKFLTTARVDKHIHKLVDEGVIPEDYDISMMGDILRNLGDRIREDMIEEEADELPQDHDEKVMKKSIGKVLPQEVKAIMAKEGKM